MSSIVKVGSVLYLKVGTSLEKDEMDELEALKITFEKSSDEDFVFDLTSLHTATNRACNLLATIQDEARRKGKVYVLTPDAKMREQLLDLHAIKVSEIYENRTLMGVAMKASKNPVRQGL
ncbi:MAG: hypothetical protein H7177_04905 [Rhizobacter sp.]|nr:hypothetical protein [Bacteriovorax sp.]